MAAKWLAAKKRRDRDIRDFVVVHGKILKPENDGSLDAFLPTDVGRTGGRRTKQATLPHLHSSWSRERRERELKAPASRFSKGVRKKAPTLVIQEGTVERNEEREGEGREVENPRCERLQRVADKENTSGGQSSTTTVGLRRKVKVPSSGRLPLSPVNTACAPLSRRRRRGGSEDTPSPIPLAKRSAPSVFMVTPPYSNTPQLLLSCPETAVTRATPDEREEGAAAVEWKEVKRKRHLEEEVEGMERFSSADCHDQSVPDRSGRKGSSVSSAPHCSLVAAGQRGDLHKSEDKPVNPSSQGSEGGSVEWDSSSNTPYFTGSPPSCPTSWDTEHLLAELSSCEKLE